MRKAEYQRYLRSPEWQTIRRLKLDTAGRKCQHCKTTEAQLHVHHLTYDRVGHERLSDLAVLCNVCHMTAHGLLDGLEPVISKRQIVQRPKLKKRSTPKLERKKVYPPPRPNPNDELHRRQVEIKERQRRARELRISG